MLQDPWQQQTRLLVQSAQVPAVTALVSFAPEHCSTASISSDGTVNTLSSHITHATAAQAPLMGPQPPTLRAKEEEEEEEEERAEREHHAIAVTLAACCAPDADTVLDARGLSAAKDRVRDLFALSSSSLPGV
jgi:hypothetical protein